MKARVVTHAHRGESGMAPENTAAAFELAISADADFIEADVRFSADGELVVVHDRTLARTSDAERAFPDRMPWRVRDFTLAELETLDIGGWYDAAFAGQRILTLDELLDLLDDRVGLNLELKSAGADPDLPRAVAAHLRKRPGWTRGPLMVCSFNEPALLDFHAELPDVPLAFLDFDVPSREKLKELSTWVSSVNPDYRRIRPDHAARVIEAGLDLVPWTVDSPAHWQQVLDLGATGIVTNYTGALTEALRGNGPTDGEDGVVVEHIETGAGEHVVLRNEGDQPADVSGWYLRDQLSKRVLVGAGYVIPAGGTLTVHTGRGENTGESFYNGMATPVWSDEGDSASLHRADGTLVDLYAYLPAGPEGA